jgi:hypothetical protein
VSPAVLAQEGSDADLSPSRIQGRKRFLSATRYPFLSLLFAGSSRRSDYLVADETEASEADNPMVAVFLWDDPVLSLTWLLTLQVVFYLLAFADYSVITIASIMGLWQLLVDFAIVRMAPSLKQLGFLPYNFDPHKVVKTNKFFSVRLIKQVGGAVNELCEMVNHTWVEVVAYGNWPQVLIAVRFVFAVFIRSFSLPITMWLLFMIMFTMPISYTSRNLFADATREFVRLRGAFSAVTFRDLAWKWSERLGRLREHHEAVYAASGSPMALAKVRAITATDLVVTAWGSYLERFAAWMGW